MRQLMEDVADLIFTQAFVRTLLFINTYLPH